MPLRKVGLMSMLIEQENYSWAEADEIKTSAAH